jgi:hypothetical protein
MMKEHMIGYPIILEQLGTSHLVTFVFIHMLPFACFILVFSRCESFVVVYGTLELTTQIERGTPFSIIHGKLWAVFLK